MSKSKRESFSATRLAPLEFRVFRRLQELFVSSPLRNGGEKWLVACSGGRDSVALAHLLSKIAPRLGVEIALAHVHHGPSREEELDGARERALRSVRSLARDLRIKGFVLRYRGKKELHSEAELRAFRLRALEKIRKASAFERVVFAHHRDDLFETRMIRLLRGTGAQGLRSMQIVSDLVLRPLLEEPGDEIQSYVAAKSLKWVEDPSNAESGPLRNWLRNEWLPSLEAKRSGATRSMMRSLDNLVEALAMSDSTSPREVAGLELRESMAGLVMEREIFDRSSREQQRQMIASFLLVRGARNFTSAHVEEIRKRLDSPRQSIEFRILKFKWVIEAGYVRVHEYEPDSLEISAT